MPSPDITMVLSALLAEQVITDSRNVDIDSDRFDNLDDEKLTNILDWLYETKQIQGYVVMDGFFLVQMYPLESN